MEEETSGPSPDMPATAEPSSSETDKEVSPVVAAVATSSSMGEEPGSDQAATPPMWERGGLGGTQQGASPAPDSGHAGPGPGLGLTSTVSGTSEDLRPPRRRPPPGKQIPCSSPGCCLSFPSVRDLAQHLRTHCPPTQSLEGKLFRCSALSCTETFPNMQELVAHGKLHYKPNRYFKCENCLLRFRTHRSLFKHLHVCAEHAQSPAPPPPPALDKEPPAPERPPESDPASAPGLQFPLLEPFTTPAPAPTGPFLPYLNPAPFGLSPPRPRPFLAAAPGPPASSAAVWKKSQGAGGSPRRPQGGSDTPAGACRARGPEPHCVGAHARSLLVHAVRLLHGLAARHDPTPGGPPPHRPRGPVARAAAPRRAGGPGPAGTQGVAAAVRGGVSGFLAALNHAALRVGCG
ncbi:zinc finger protein 414 isoform X1 [Eubalaena glacialis]|uniref:zinc finger protein 414 isoform X1 n=1 Tax=Eubalaena glacialis TaxID=27606 RepID=UPI002A5A81E4|nr:zinc finger protein 414 isoform X1 [Eubalaena glacialis]